MMQELIDYLGLGQTNKADREMEEAIFYSSIGLNEPGLALVRGLPRSGKTTWGVSTAIKRQKLWGIPFVSNVLMKEGVDYHYIDTRKLVDEVRKINKAVADEVERQEQAKRTLTAEEEMDAAGSVWESSGVKLHKSTILWDEAWGDMDRRRTQERKNILLGYLVQMWGHLQSLLIVICSTDSFLDEKRFLPFIKFDVNCSYFSDTGISIYILRNRHMERIPGINPTSMYIDVGNWAGKAFDSFGPVAVDESLLKSVLRKEGLKDAV